jgi:hypothetical protein
MVRIPMLARRMAVSYSYMLFGVLQNSLTNDLKPEMRLCLR